MNLWSYLQGVATKFGIRTLITFLALLLIAPPFIVAYSMTKSWPATFSISAQTEILELDTGHQNVPNWFITMDRLRLDGRDSEPFVGQLSIGQHSRVRLIRLDRGALWLDIEAVGDGPAARFYDQADDPSGLALERVQAEIRVPDRNPMTLPVSGRAVIGQSVFAQAVGTSPILLEANVEVFGLSAVGRNRFSADRTELDPGDRFEIQYDGERGGGNGMIRVVSDSPGIRAVFHADGYSATISRFGTGGHVLRPSLWARFSSDPLFQGMIALYATLVPVIAFGLSTAISYQYLKQIAENSDENSKKKKQQLVAGPPIDGQTDAGDIVSGDEQSDVSTGSNREA